MEQNFIVTKIDRVILVGKEEYPDQKIAFHGRLNSQELIFHFSGQATVFFDDLVLETTPNTIRYLPQGEIKKYEVIRHLRGECIVVYFQSDVPLSPCAFVINIQQNEKIGGLFRRIFATWVSKDEGYYFQAVSLLYRILSEIQKSNYQPKLHSQKIEPALNMIHNDFLKTDFSLNTLATACKMSESYFQRLFKEKYGISPKRYIIQLKINHACDLLRLEYYTVSQIAEMCNFTDVYFFSRQFKEYVGITPTQFIQKYKSGK